VLQLINVGSCKSITAFVDG